MSDHEDWEDDAEDWLDESLHLLPHAITVVPPDAQLVAENIYRTACYQAGFNTRRTVDHLKQLLAQMQPRALDGLGIRVDDEGDCKFCGSPVQDYERHIKCHIASGPYECTAQALARAELEFKIRRGGSDLMMIFVARVLFLAHNSGDWIAANIAFDEIPRESSMLARSEEDRAIRLVRLFNILGMGEYNPELFQPPPDKAGGFAL